MVPILLDLKFLKIHTFGVFLVLAFFWGCFLLWRVMRLTSFKEEEVFDGLFLSLGGSLLFARLIYVILNFKSFGFSILKFILINGYPGLSLYGGLFGGFLVFALYLLNKKLDIQEAFDYLVSPVFLALAIGKIGGFFSGVEYGVKTKFFFAVKYLGREGFRHLTPFYESLLFFLGCYLSYRLIFEIRKQKLTKGFAFFFAIWYFSLVFFVFDKLKGNHLYFLGQSVNRGLSFGLLLTFSFYYIYYFRDLIIHKFKLLLNIKPIYGNKASERTSQETTKPARK